MLLPRPEAAKSYELGVKTSLGRAFTFNASVFQIDYNDQLTQFEGVQYWNPIGAGKIDRTSLAFYRNIDSRVRGFELEMTARPVDGLSLGANISYSRITSKGGLLPANPGDCAGTVALNAANFAAGTQMNFCPWQWAGVEPVRRPSRRRSTAVMKCRLARSRAISAST